MVTGISLERQQIQHKKNVNYKTLIPDLPPVGVGLLQQDEALALPYADLPSVGAAVVVVVLGLQHHRAAGHAAHGHAPVGHHRARRLVADGASPGP